MGVDMLLLDFQVCSVPSLEFITGYHDAGDSECKPTCNSQPNTSPDFTLVTLGLDLLLIGPSLSSGKLNKKERDPTLQWRDRPMLLHRSSEVALFLGCQERPTRWETMGVDMLLLDFQVHASAYLQTDIPTKEIIHCQMVGALKELEKLWLVREVGYAPAVGMKFESCDDDYNCYNCCAKHFGFLVRVKSSWF
ncbi:hypothetical protein F2Q70_00030810 [Brassica cretica]|uniref:Uncharacterized protein n=1 Tax=Brassica cretica TaxID=69181 RepID=A0A8S9FPQ6_BRACR|nr:hypothetical protein F2Q70_00030810 [Brassica cretica]